MKITFYRSHLCPRCHMAGKYLRQITAEDTGLQVVEIEIITNPVKTWRQGIRLIPALQIEKHTLSGLYLSKKRIKKFIEQFKAQRKP